MADRIRTIMSGLRRLTRNRRGVAAVEFAMIGPVFILLTCGILENGLILLTQSALDNATRVAARQVMLGSISSSTAFKTAICNNAGSLIPSCSSNSNLQFNVQAGSTFASFNSTPQTDSSGNMTNTAFNPGVSKQKVLVQVGYNRQFLIPWYGTFAGVRSELLISTVAFKNEPY